MIRQICDISFHHLGHSWDITFPGRREGTRPSLQFFYTNKHFICPWTLPTCTTVAFWVLQHFSLKSVRTLSHTFLRGKAIPTLSVRISISYSLIDLDFRSAGKKKREHNPSCIIRNVSSPQYIHIFI